MIQIRKIFFCDFTKNIKAALTLQLSSWLYIDIKLLLIDYFKINIIEFDVKY